VPVITQSFSTPEFVLSINILKCPHYVIIQHFILYNYTPAYSGENSSISVPVVTIGYSFLPRLISFRRRDPLTLFHSHSQGVTTPPTIQYYYPETSPKIFTIPAPLVHSFFLSFYKFGTTSTASTPSDNYVAASNKYAHNFPSLDTTSNASATHFNSVVSTKHGTYSAAAKHTKRM